jgi:membrane-associated protein
MEQMIHSVIDFIKSLHNPETFAQWLSSGGVILITGIIFAETGLLLGFFLPGDSLLITAGVLANPANPNAVPGLVLFELQVALTVAAIIGDQLGYFLGRKTGDAIFKREDGLLFKKKHVIEAHAFYEKYGAAAIVACRYIPIFRTFVPFIAGVAKMDYRKYLQWDILGGCLWINSLLIVGYFLGQTKLANSLDKIILLVIFVSTLPVIIGGIKKWSTNSK